MGDGGGGNSTVSQEFKPPAYTQAAWENYLAQAQGLAAGGLPQYQGQQVANQSPMTTQGLQMLTDYAMQGTPERTGSGQALMGAMRGTVNPYSTTMNPYMGENPYLSKMIDSSNAKISEQYQKGTAAQNDAAFARSGAFGGSAHADKIRQNEQTLAGALGANTNNLLGQNYQQSAQLADTGLNRAAQGWQAGMGNALQGAQISQGQQGLDASAIQSLLAGGRIPQQYQQQLLNAAQAFFNSGTQNPFTSLDFLGNALQRASGSGGTNTQVGNMGGASNVSNLLGAATLAGNFIGG